MREGVEVMGEGAIRINDDDVERPVSASSAGVRSSCALKCSVKLTITSAPIRDAAPDLPEGGVLPTRA